MTNAYAWGKCKQTELINIWYISTPSLISAHESVSAAASVKNLTRSMKRIYVSIQTKWILNVNYLNKYYYIHFANISNKTCENRKKWRIPQCVKLDKVAWCRSDIHEFLKKSVILCLCRFDSCGCVGLVLVHDIDISSRKHTFIILTPLNPTII